MAPLGMGAVLHLYAGVSPIIAVALTAAATVPAIAATIICALAPHRPALVRERSMAQIRSAVIKGKIQAKDAALLLGDDVRASVTPADEGTGKHLAG